MPAQPNPPNAFDSTDPGVKIALANLNPFTRSVLTWLHIDPALSRPTERDRLRTLVRLAAVSASNETTGKSLLVLREMWRRGFPVPAFHRVTKVTYGDGVTPEADFTYALTGKPSTESSGTGAAVGSHWLKSIQHQPIYAVPAGPGKKDMPRLSVQLRWIRQGNRQSLGMPRCLQNHKESSIENYDEQIETRGTIWLRVSFGGRCGYCVQSALHQRGGDRVVAWCGPDHRVLN